MLQPKRRKFRKEFRGKMHGKSQRGSGVDFGEFGLKALESGWLASNQIEAGRRAITGSIKRGGKVWVRAFPDKPVSGRTAGQRMGGGKGDIDRYVAVVKPGRIIYEVAGITEELAIFAFDRASAKMPFKTKIVKRD